MNGDIPSISNYKTTSNTYGLTASCGPISWVETGSVQPEKKEKEIMTLRIVKVYIADPNESIPLDSRLIYSGDEKLTDLTDQELFYEIDIRSLLEKHNEYRVTLINKKVKDRTERLEPVRIRDLKMVVVDEAKF